MADIMVKEAGEPQSPAFEARSRVARRRRMEMKRFSEQFHVFPGVSEQPEDGQKVGKKDRKGRVYDGKCERMKGEVTGKLPEEGMAVLGNKVSGFAAEGSAGSGSAMEVPAHGYVSVYGMSREMEDAVSIQPGFFGALHFFAVFDGHGGSHVALSCKDRLHLLLAQELHSSSPTLLPQSIPPCPPELALPLQRSFSCMDEEVLNACSICGHDAASCGDTPLTFASEMVGSTAVVAILCCDRIVVANCGDSRAVLCRAGKPFPLTTDHKPDRPDELARIEASGGRVIYWNGPRVLGVLAMSRAIGDRYLKPYITSEPEITITDITPDDECLILASDGLWDVLPNELVCNVARQCLFGRSPPRLTQPESSDLVGSQGLDDGSQSPCTLAATLLTKLALARKSSDNISVIVINLKRNQN
ncbi:probable protein phosphatase 2C 24 isoform X1 [Amborella trichopoda]|uniref:protein-serine/threonine phosphatase n=1 Tax=Amborella trichopoda TaxID=13333 RepID=W1NI92_AMBTC|nr:probable protein phosphatase 2C 24 isoform X1 [Amborella trichopoda]ERM94939.1 hypothetical protein AMTR_s00009p00196700 [Amborella trichopoda]|eukprot:XP_006827523.1 probable protein phosphatase 2C 24 isoform X1 [Amborella trichopoda]